MKKTILIAAIATLIMSISSVLYADNINYNKQNLIKVKYDVISWSCTSCNYVNGVAYGWNCDDGKKHDCYTEGGRQAACYYACRSAGCGFSPDGGRCIDK